MLGPNSNGLGTIVKIDKLELKLIGDVEESLNYHSQKVLSKLGRVSEYGGIDMKSMKLQNVIITRRAVLLLLPLTPHMFYG